MAGKENEIVTIFRTIGMDKPEQAYQIMLRLVQEYIVANGRASLSANNLRSVIMNLSGGTGKLHDEISAVVKEFDKLSHSSKNIKSLQSLGWNDLRDVRSTREYIKSSLEEAANPKAIPIRTANLAKEAEITAFNFEKNTRPIPVEIRPFTNTEELGKTFQSIKTQLKAIPDDTQRVRTASEVISKLEKEHQVNLINIKDLKEKIDYATAYRRTITSISDNATRDVKTGKKTGANAAYMSQFETTVSGIKKQTDATIEATKAEKVRADAQADVVAQQTKTDASIKTAIGKLIRYRVAFFAMRGAIQSVQTALKDFIDLQYQLVGLEIVMDRQTDSITRYRKEAFLMAQTFGVAIKDIIGIYTTWAQTGLKQNEVLEATKATLVGMNAIGGTAQEVVSSLTAAVYTYGYSVEELTTVISKWLAVQREFPVSAKDLAESLRVVGSAGKVVGVELDSLMGLVSSINALTRKSGSEIGQSLKTIFARIPRGATIAEFESLGIPVLSTAENFRSLIDVLNDLDKQWKGLSSTQKAAMAIETSGVRRYSDFIALMDNWDIVMKAIIISQKSSNESLDANAMILSSMKKHWESAKVAVDQFGIGIGQILSGPLGGLLNLFSKLMKAVNSVGAVIRVFSGLIAGVSVFVGLKIAVTALTFAFDWLKKSITSYIIAASAASKATIGFAGAITKVSLATRLAGWLNIAITVVSAFALMFGTFSTGAADASSASEEFSRTLENTYNSSKSFLDALTKEKEQLSELPDKIKAAGDALLKAKKNTEGYTKRSEELNKLLGIFPTTYQPLNLAIKQYNTNINNGINSISEMKSATDGFIGTLDEQTEATKKLVEQQRESVKQDKLKAISLIELDQLALDETVTTLTNKKLIGIDEILPNTIDINKRVREVGDVLKNNLDRAPETLEQLDVSKRFSLGIDKIKSLQVENGTIASQMFLKGFISDFKESIKAYNKEIETSLSGHPDLISKYLIDEGTVSEELINLDKRLNVFINKFKLKNEIPDNETFVSRLLGDTTFLGEFGSELSSFMQTQKLELEKGGINLGSNLFAQYGALENQITNLRLEIVKLYEEPSKPRENFLIGREQTNDAKAAIDKINDSMSEYSRIQEQLSVESKTIKYGEIFDLSESKLEKSIGFIKQFANNINDAKNDLARLQREYKIVADTMEISKGYDKAITQEETDNVTKLMNARLKLYPQLAAIYRGKGGRVETIAPIDELSKSQQDLKDSISALEESIKNKNLDRILKELDAYVFQYNTFRKTMDRFALNMKAVYAPAMSKVDMQINLLEGLEGKEKDLFALKKKRIELEREYAEAVASYTVPATDRVKQKIEAINNYTESMSKLIFEEGQTRIKALLELYTAAANEMRTVFRDVLSGSFQNIPTNILDNAEKRRELARELRSTEFELQEARRSGDVESITQAQYRVDLVKYEMKEYKRGWAEVKAAILDVFGSISGTYWKQMSERLAQSISDISFKNTTIGDVIGNAILSSTNQFLKDWVITTEAIFAKIMAEVNNLETARQSKIAFLKKLTEPEYGQIYMKGKSQKTTPLRPDFNITEENIPTFNKKLYTQEIKVPFALGGKEYTPPNWDMPNLVAAYDKDTEHILFALDELDYNNTKITSDTSQVIKGSLMMLMSTLAISAFGTKNKGANVGATFGSMAGSAFVNDQMEGIKKLVGGGKLIGGAIGILGGPIGSLLGGMAGGLLGGLLGGGEPPEEPLQRAIVDNTEATIQNTIAMKELDKAIFNAPTRFNVPTFSGGFGASPISITVHTTGNAKDIAQQVKQVISDTLKSESRIYGTRGYRVV